MLTFETLWAGLKQSGAPLPYMLVDAAGLDGTIRQLPRECFSQLACLFAGDLARELADVAPYLARFASFGPDAAAVAHDLLRRHAGVLLAPRPDGTPEAATFSQVHRHFRKFNVVYDPQGTPLFFRYYDPRVLPEIVRVLHSAQLRQFFGPLAQFVVMDSELRLARLSVDDDDLLVLA